MPTPIYELQQYLKSPLIEVRKTRGRLVMWSIIPLCLFSLPTERFDLIGFFIFLGGIFMLPLIFDLPSIQVTESGVKFKTMIGSAYSAWSSIEPFEVRTGRRSHYLEALVVGSETKNFLFGFKHVKDKTYLSLELPVAFCETTAEKLNEFRRLTGAPAKTNRSSNASQRPPQS